MEHLIGQTLDRYQITELLGEGGMGAVFKAHDLTLQRDVALKVMHPQFARKPNFQNRFLQEARTAARLDHPGIVKVHDFGQADSALYIVMEFIPGDDLATLLQKMKAANRRIILAEATALIRQVCLALHYAHGQGILHRDIKPGNIMLKNEPSEGLPFRPVLTDLGLARLLEGERMTQEGTTMGTPAYMSPEQAQGEETDSRSDVYSVGVLLYELVVGRLPFPVRTVSEAIRYHTKEAPPSPRFIQPEIPIDLEQVILKALQKNPAHRFESAAAMAAALGASAEIPVEPPTEVVLESEPALEEPEGLRTQYQLSLAAAPKPPEIKAFPAPSRETFEDRIQIMTQDKTTRAVPILKTEFTIGRSDENDIPLDDSLVSSQHVRVAFDETDYRITDLNSTNGTYLGDTRLLPGIPEIWPGEKPLRIGNHWLHLQPATGKPSKPGPATAATVSPPSRFETRTEDGRIAAIVEISNLEVEPGGSVSTRISILNQGVLVDHFKVSVEGIPASWVSSPAPTVRLMPGMRGEVQLTIQPPRTPESRAGEYPLNFLVTSEKNPHEIAKAPAALRVLPYIQYTATMRPQKVSATQEGDFALEFSSQCNSELTLQLSARDPEEGCQYQFAPTEVHLPPGESQSCSLKVTPRNPLVGGAAKSYPFVVEIRPQAAPQNSQQIPGELKHVPPSLELGLRPQRTRGVAKGSYNVRLFNQGNAPLTARLEATDPEESCRYRFEASEVVVTPGQERFVPLTVEPRTPLTSEQERSFNFTVSARLQEAPGVIQQAEGEFIQVPPSFKVVLAPEKQQGGKGRYAVKIQNLSETGLTFKYSAMDPAQRCGYEFEEPQLQIGAGQSGSVQMDVLPKSRLRGEEAVNHPFTVTVQPVQAPALVRQAYGELEQVPGMSIDWSVGAGGWWIWLLIVLGWFIATPAVNFIGSLFCFDCLFESIIFNLRVEPFIAEVAVFWLLRSVLIGSIGGLITGIALRVGESSFGLKNILQIILGWAVIFTLLILFFATMEMGFHQLFPPDFLVPTLIGLAGGWVAGVAIRGTDLEFNFGSVAGSAIGWGLGWFVGAIIPALIFIPPLFFDLQHIVGAAIGGGVTVWLLRRAQG